MGKVNLDGFKFFDSHYGKRCAIIKDELAFIPLGKDAKQGYAIVSECDSDIDQMKWRLDSHGYPITTGINQKGVRTNVPMHHLIFGKPRKGYVIDHINRNILDNRRENLREVEYKINSLNRTFNHTRDDHPYPGVRRMVSSKTGKRYDKWVVEIKVNHKFTYIGSFNTIEEAINARKQAELELFGEKVDHSNDSGRNRSRWGR